MNNKITLPELVNLLSDKTGVSKRQCETFLKGLFAAVSDALINQDSVKIKDLGTFKLTEIEARKSVDVNTGNEIEIAGHNRVTFVAAKTLAALINEPFEAFETVELADSVTDEMLADAENDDATPIDADEPAADDSADADDDAADQPTSDAETDEPDLPLTEWTPDTPAEPEAEPDTVAADTDTHDADANADAEPGIPEPQQPSVEDAQTSYVIEDEDEDEPQHAEAAVKVEEEASEPTAAELDDDEDDEDAGTEAEGTEDADDADDAEEVEPVRRHRRQRTFGNGFVVGILTSMLAIVIAGGAWLYFSGYFSGSKKTPETTTVAKSDSIAAAPQPQAKAATPAATDSVAQNSEAAKPAASEKPSAKEEKAKEADTKPSDEPVYDTITKTRYLTTMAKEHYGSYHLWPYIYEANKSLGHPDKIRPGTKVVIPPLSRYGVNPKNPDDIAKAKRKGAAIYARYEKDE